MGALTDISWNTRSTHNIRKDTAWALGGPVAAILLLTTLGCQGLRDGAYEPTWNPTNPSRGTATNANNAMSANVTLVSAPLSGSFTTINTNSVVGTAGNGIFAGDFNNDGNQDVLVSDNTSLVYLFHGKGDGTFQTPITVTVDAPTYSVAIADYNLD